VIQHINTHEEFALVVPEGNQIPEFSACFNVLATFRTSQEVPLCTLLFVAVLFSSLSSDLQYPKSAEFLAVSH